MKKEKRHFEFMRLVLERVRITEESLRDWRQTLGRLSQDLNGIMDVPFLFVCWMERGNKGSLDIFWHRNPAEWVRIKTENEAKRIWREKYKCTEKEEIHVHHEETGLLEGESWEEWSETNILRYGVRVDDASMESILGIAVNGALPMNEMDSLAMKYFVTACENVICSSITMKAYMQEVEFHAVRDPLTQAYNARMFWDLLDYEVGRSSRHKNRFSLCLIDMDDFKRINDTLGHDIGDQFLKEVVRVIMNSVRGEDIVFRYGGDEFAVIFPETGTNQGFIAAKRILEGIRDIRMETQEGVPLPIVSSVSIGMATYPEHAETGGDIFRMADQMVMKAKKSGKGVVLFPEDGGSQYFQRMTSTREGEMVRHVRNGNVFPHFQPIEGLVDGKIKGYEVFSRIRADDGSILSASEFIDLAGRAGLVAEMDFMVFRKAISESLMGGRESLLFMNLSQRSAIVPDFMTRLKNLLKETGYHAENIVFEISEGETIRNMGILVGIMKEVRSMGIRFAIDDFGSGRMLQNCMRELPIDFLKIDGSFVQGTGKGVLMDGALVKSFVTFAKSTGVVTIAENIENEKTRRILMENGVDWGQGYHIGIPECSLKDPGG